MTSSKGFGFLGRILLVLPASLGTFMPVRTEPSGNPPPMAFLLGSAKAGRYSYTFSDHLTIRRTLDDRQFALDHVPGQLALVDKVRIPA